MTDITSTKAPAASATCSCNENEVVARIVDAYRGRKGILVDVLHDTQSEFGYLSDSVLRRLAAELGIPLAQIYGVATFYAGFRFTPPPRNQIRVCTGTACHVRGATGVLRQFENSLGIQAGEMTSDGWIGLETVSCVGCCALAPAIVVNGAVRRTSSPAAILGRLSPPAKGEEDVA